MTAKLLTFRVAVVSVVASILVHQVQAAHSIEKFFPERSVPLADEKESHRIVYDPELLKKDPVMDDEEFLIPSPSPFDDGLFRPIPTDEPSDAPSMFPEGDDDGVDHPTVPDISLCNSPPISIPGPTSEVTIRNTTPETVYVKPLNTGNKRLGNNMKLKPGAQIVVESAEMQYWTVMDSCKKCMGVFSGMTRQVEVAGDPCSL